MKINNELNRYKLVYQGKKSLKPKTLCLIYLQPAVYVRTTLGNVDWDYSATLELRSLQNEFKLQLGWLVHSRIEAIQL